MSEFTHYPVLLNECIEGLNIRPDGVYLDGTLGRAGHSREIAKRLNTGRLICVDRDEAALESAGRRLDEYMDKVTLVHSNFDRVGQIVEELELSGVDGMLFDLGVSSPQLDDSSRGFSYMADAPLDMRMDRSEGLTAAEVVNTWSLRSCGASSFSTVRNAALLRLPLLSSAAGRRGLSSLLWSWWTSSKALCPPRR